MSKIDWAARGWIVGTPDLPENFRELTWEELPRARGSVMKQVRVYDSAGHVIGAVVAIDTNRKMCWRLPLLDRDFPDEVAQGKPSGMVSSIAQAARRMEKARGRKLIAARYSRLEEL